MKHKDKSSDKSKDKPEGEVIDLDQLVEDRKKHDVVFKIKGEEYRPKKMTKDVLDDFQKAVLHIKNNKDTISPHEAASKQLSVILGTPPELFDDYDIVVVKRICDKVLESLEIMGEPIEL